MSKHPPSPPKKKTQLRTYLLIAAIALSLVSFFAIRAYLTRPTDLGPKLQYIGKQNIGCWILCGSLPGATYCFATDMSVAELKQYFKEADCITYDEGLSLYNEDYTAMEIGCRSKVGEHLFSMNYYDKTDKVVQINNLKQTHKRLVVSINNSRYMQAKQSL